MKQNTGGREDASAPFTRQAQVKPSRSTTRTATLMPLSQPHARNLPMKYGQKVSLEKTSRGTRSLT
jgi:hypothetical protein